MAREGVARFGDLSLSNPSAVTHDIADLTSGVWAVVLTFEGDLTAVRFDSVRAEPEVAGAEEGVRPGEQPTLGGEWTSSLGETAYRIGVADVRARIAAGTVYQVNLCRVLSHPVPADFSVAALAERITAGNPAPYAGVIDVPAAGLHVVCASPEGFLERDGRRLLSRPIKGTAPTVGEMLRKDYSENVMIVDLVRHDLGAVCLPGTVSVDHLCRVEEHPGLVHLVSDVSGQLRPGVEWSEILAATFPPGSVSGAPKHTALQAIRELEPVPRGPYCGAIGWIDADRDRARLAVGIRSFWIDEEAEGRRWLRFGTGAGITWGSDPQGEWDETELKACRLIALASGRLGA